MTAPARRRTHTTTEGRAEQMSDPHNRRGRRWLAALAVSALLAPMMATQAAAQGGGGGGSGGGGGGQPGEDPGSLYSDLVLALRDVDGLPIYTEYEVLGETGTEIEYCVQPISYEPLPGITETVLNEVDGEQVYAIPLMGDLMTAAAEEEDEVEVCDPQPAYAMYVSEAELERLNLARTDEDVISSKLNDLWKRLIVADELTLDGAGRLVIDGAVVDAGPEHAAMFQSLLETATVPPIVAPMQVTPFGPWELAAASVGAAASKFAPLSIDAVLYYMRVTDAAESDGWRAPPLVSSTGEQFVDFRDFSYTRSEVFKGGVTWLDVPSLTWQTGRIIDEVDFAELPDIADGGTLHNAAAFAQLADDVRAAILFFHQYEALAGFYMDPVGVDTFDQQLIALTAPAVRWDGLPEDVVQTETFPVTASLFNPHAGADITGARLRVTVSTDGGFGADDAARLTAVDPVSTQAITFALEGDQLVGYWGPPAGFLVEPGYQATTAFDVKIGAGAPVGTYEVTLDLVQGTDAKATDVAMVEVLPAELTARWASITEFVEQDSFAQLVSTVFNPEGAPVADAAQLRLTVDPLATEGFTVDGPKATLHSEAVAIPLTLTGDGSLEATLDVASLAAGAGTEVVWWLNVASGAPLGWYDLTVEIVDGLAAADMESMYVAAAPVHGPVDPGDPDDPVVPPVVPVTPTAVTMFEQDQIYRLYLAAFDRTPDAAGLAYWIGTPLTVPQIASYFVTSPEFLAKYGSLSNTQFVQQLYLNILGRTGDAAGVTYWISVLNSGVTRGVVLTAFANSDELIMRLGGDPSAPNSMDRPDQVHRLYEAAYNRTPDAAGLAYWIGTPLTVPQIASYFVTSPEFLAKYGSLSNTQFVQQLYLNILGRTGEATGVTYWIAVLNSGVSRGVVLTEFANSYEFVKMLSRA